MVNFTFVKVPYPVFLDLFSHTYNYLHILVELNRYIKNVVLEIRLLSSLINIFLISMFTFQIGFYLFNTKISKKYQRSIILSETH